MCLSLLGLCLLDVTHSDLFHEHENLVDPGDILLHLRDIMLQHGSFNTLSTPESLHDPRVLVSNVPLNHRLHRLDFIEPMVKADDLTNELGALGYQRVVDRLVDRFKTVAERLFHIADAMKLRVVGPHDRAVVAEELLARVTEVPERLSVQHAELRLRHVRIQNRLRAHEVIAVLHACHLA